MPEPVRPDVVGDEAPIKGAANDLLKRDQFAQRIADILTTPNLLEGRVFAIRAAWGAGKSSLKNLIIEILDGRNGQAKWLDFNPWQWGDGDAIAAALFSQMASKLGGGHSPRARARAQALRKYGAILVGASAPLKGAGDDKIGFAAWLPVLLLGLAGIGANLPALPVTTLVSYALFGSAFLVGAGNLLKMAGADRSGEPLSSVRADLEKRLKRLPGPLIVFVDDIDRLEPEQIRMLIRQVKVNANLPNVVFVLLFQPSIVIKALNDVSDGSGSDYLEKIVQANFDLPAVPPDKIFRLFMEQLGPTIGTLAVPENGFTQVRWGNMLLGGVKPYVRNLRDARRMLSSVAIHLPLHKGEGAFEVNVVDFVALEALRVFEPGLHTTIANNKALFLQSSRFSQDGAGAVNKAAIDEIIKKVADTRREASTALLRELFPQISWAFGGSHYGNEWIKSWVKEKRVCTAEMFDRYFELQIPEGTVSETRLGAFFASAKTHEELLAQIDGLASDGLLPALVARLDTSVEEIPISTIRTILPALFGIGGRLKAGSESQFNSSFISAWRSAVWYLRRVPDAKDRSRIMLDAITHSHALAVPATLISLDIDARAKSEPRKEYIFDDDGLADLREAWVKKVRLLAATDEELLKQDDLVSLLYRWRDFEGSFDGPRDWLDRIVAKHGKLPELVSRFVGVGRSQTAGDYVSTRFEHVERSSIEDFFDLKTLAASLAALDRSDLSDDQKRAVELLENEIPQWLSTPRSTASGEATSEDGKPPKAARKSARRPDARPRPRRALKPPSTV